MTCILKLNMTEKNKIARRNLIKGLGLGLVSLSTTPVNSLVAMNTEHPLEDPITKFPMPPFKSQSQKWPGLAGKMDPVPDHGEKSYKGSGRLAGRKALITGGDSGMGRAAAIAYAREGADVAINYLPDEEEDAKEVIQLIKEAGRKAV
ncbi:MAG: family oxidoreductase, partial [Bacteroidota bacterium]|nr:family oxidoreductase [Bacteroidota bacterium]